MTPKRKKSRKWIIGLVLLLAVAAGALTVPQFLNRNTATISQNIKTAAAETGTIEKTVTGTGNLTSDDTVENMDIPDSITIDEVMVEAGAKVKKGDTLVTLDPIVLQQAIYDTQDEINSLDTQLNTAMGVTEAQYVSSSISGRIKQILIEEGDDVAQTMITDGALIILSIDGKMEVSFVPSSTDGIQAGDDVTVTLSDGTEKDGVIASISAKQCSVTINDNGPAVNDQAAVTLADNTLLGSGALTISTPLAISGTNGIAADILYSIDDYINEGAKLIKLEDAAVSRDYDQLYADRLEKTDLLNMLLVYQETNSISALSDGTIETVMISDGQNTGTASTTSATAGATATDASSSAATGSSASTAAPGSTASAASTGGTASSAAIDSTAAASSATSSAGKMTAFTIRTGSVMELTASIDELDILSLAVDQKANITLDALPDQTFDGTIIEISDTGTVSSGVTTYAVTLAVASDPSMRVGMSASAAISITKKDDIIRIPLEGLEESGAAPFVYVGTAVSETSLGEKRTVTTGISDGEFVEITSGLADGEKINYVYTTGTQTSAVTSPFGGGMGANTSAAGSSATDTSN